MGRDLWIAVRMLSKSPGFSIAVIASLALGIAANTALFAVVDAVFLRPLPYERPGELVTIEQPRRVPPLEELRHAKSLAGVAAFIPRNFPVSGKEGIRLVFGCRVSGDLFHMLGVRPVIGRIFANEDEQQP